MALVWVICGAGRRVGKTHLAQALCATLPDAVYAKQGCSAKKPGKPEDYFRTDDELAAFVDGARPGHAHVVVESNEWARAGRGDIVVFVDGIPGCTDTRADAPLLCSRSSLQISAEADRRDWETALSEKLDLPALRNAVCDVLSNQQRFLWESDPAQRRVEPLRVCVDGSPALRDPGMVIVEELLTIMVDGVGNFAVMCTPTDVQALALGFVFSEGLISSIEDVAGFSHNPEQRSVALRLDAPPQHAVPRNLIVTSSCGLCGSRNVDQLLAGGLVSGDSLCVSAATLRGAVQAMQGRQKLFRRTGGAHAAGIFDAEGRLIAFGEDIGRHNALDKAVGGCLLREVSPAGCGAVLSGRVSLELVAKAARAGLEIIAAVSAPSSLAIQAAQRCNITLCGFVREQRATVYTHPRRIEEAAAS